jgi:uncharacterized heparinase superfamily protein
MESGPDRWRLYGLAFTEAGRSLRAGAGALVRPRGLRPRRPARLLLAPQDLRTADATVATDIYAGYFVFAGRALATGGRSPFDFPPPSPAWGEALNGFGWLRHLRAADTALARANARSLVDDFLARDRALRARGSAARGTAVTARRLIAFLSQSPLLIDGADHAFYLRFLEGIGAAVARLERDGLPSAMPQRRLLAAVGLCYAGLCCEGFDGVLRRATRVLARELDRQILPDGGHESRNPRIQASLLLDLLSLRQIYASRGVETPDALVRAIDRMIPMLRLFRLGDGALAHMNGMGVTAADQIATILIYDEARSGTMLHAPHTGYERLEAGSTVVVAETGPSPPVRQSADAHAGCLSFELSSGAQRIVVNCGAPRSQGESVREAARSTAAHSTATVGGASSCRFLSDGGWWWFERGIVRWLKRRLGSVVLSGPVEVPVERAASPEGPAVAARHDGFRPRFGITHERRWRLNREGSLLEGEDVFLTDAGSVAPDAVLRFHLSPAVRATRVEDGRAVDLALPNRETWRFTLASSHARLEESVFLAASDGGRRTEQIVVPVVIPERPMVAWRFERLTGPERRGGR